MRYFLFILILFLYGCAGLVQHKPEFYRVASIPEIERVSRPASVAAPAPSPAPASPTITKPNENTKPEIYQTSLIDKYLFSASFAFFAPYKAKLKEEIEVTFVIDPNKLPEELAKMQIEGATNKSSGNILVARFVSAKLNAPDFIEISASPTTQELSDKKSTNWSWRLRADSAGEFPVILTVTAVVKTNGVVLSEHQIETFKSKVNITITPQQTLMSWLSKYWQWLFSTLLLPFIIWIYKSKIVKKDKD